MQVPAANPAVPMATEDSDGASTLGRAPLPGAGSAAAAITLIKISTDLAPFSHRTRCLVEDFRFYEVIEECPASLWIDSHIPGKLSKIYFFWLPQQNEDPASIL